MTPPPSDLVTAILQRVAHWLPTQGPIKEFIHHNTLHAFQNRHFFDGCLLASRLYGSRSFLPLSEYRRLAQQGRISVDVLKQVAGAELLQRLLHDDIPDETLPPGIVETGLRARWKQRGVSLHVRTHPVVFRLVGQYLDQGISMWRMPHAHTGLFEAVARLVSESWLPLAPYSSKKIRGYFDSPPEQVIASILRRFVGDEVHFERYLLEMNLSHPGWSGMVAMIEAEPHSLVLQRKVSLLDFCALELMAELAVVVEVLGEDFAPLTRPGESLEPLPLDQNYPLEWTETERFQRIWHEAYELSWTQNLYQQLEGRQDPISGTAADVQAFFCIDDRECSLRRHLEEIHPNLQTFGFAGFFGIDCLFQGAEDAFPFKHCPVPVTPHFLIREVPGGSPSVKPRRTLIPHENDADTHTLLRGFLISQTLGFWSAFKLAISLFRPTMSPLTASSLRRVDSQARLQVERGPEEECNGLQVGYSDTEMADRVGAILKSTGAFSQGLGPLVILFGHGASSVNNPYFAAYDCGACSGKAGAPNARAFALMANRPQVRAILAARGLVIPNHTWFIGALHDTTRDEVQFYDLRSMPDTHKASFEEFHRDLELALQRNAKERCRKFAMAPQNLSEKQAHEEVRRRSISIFEPRPELNHANNAACIVARRSLTRGLDLDRRVFLNSYDPLIDPNGETLTTILQAVVPVCGGINLEYYFSRIDPKIYGGGSKLPHNVNGLIGVMNGTEGDLLTGLPTQMTEIHEPIRLLMLVEQTPEVALQAALRNSSVYEWIEHAWIHYACIHPHSRRVWIYQEGVMLPL